MKPAPFDYVRVGSVDECLQTLRQADGEGKILAGGQSLMPILAMRLARPRVLVDVNRIPGLATIDRQGDTVSIGALTRHSDLLRQDVSPLLAEAARWIGHTAIRSRGTIGGSIAHADPSAELPVVSTALEAEITIATPTGLRRCSAADLFVGTMETDLKDSEMVVAVRLPVPEHWGFAEFSRRHGDFGLVTVATAVVEGEWRVAFGGIASVPYRSAECESILNGGPPTKDRIREAARAAAHGVQATGDIHASADYKRAMAEEFAIRSISQAVASSTESSVPLGAV